MTTPTTYRKLPAGIQSFKVIRREGYVYVDKTDIVWHMVNRGYKYSYLSRPRRFGKSILVDTLQAYFEGQKELFEGLRIMQLEKEWEARPVIRLDMSRGGADADTLRSYFNTSFKHYEKHYAISPDPGSSLADRLDAIITTAYEQTAKQVAVLIDEYDSPLLHSWKTPEHEGCTKVYREVFAILKADDEYEKFVFITGITKFTQLSLFSSLNNLCNISFEPEYATVCGITESEIGQNFQPELQALAEANHWTPTEAHDRLKDYYDGYHFSEGNMVDVYNPFSLIHALKVKRLRNYWAISGATSLLPKFVSNMALRLHDFEDCLLLRDTLETSDVTAGGAVLFLFQAGYLTIKSFDEDVCHLGFPNTEVRRALYEIVLPTLTLHEEEEVQSLQAELKDSLRTGNTHSAMKALQSLVADVPYSNKKLESMHMEERYRLIISTIFNAIGLRVEVEHMLATGRIDLVTQTDRTIYVIELKLTQNGGLPAAEKQLREKGYLAPYLADKRNVIGLAIELDDKGKGIKGWKRIEGKE